MLSHVSFKCPFVPLCCWDDSLEGLKNLPAMKATVFPSILRIYIIPWGSSPCGREGEIRTARVLFKNARQSHSPSKPLRVHTILLPSQDPTQAQGNSEAAGRCSSVGGRRRPSRKGRGEGEGEKAPRFLTRAAGAVAAPLAETVGSIWEIVALAFALKLAQIFVWTDFAISTHFNELPWMTP